MNNGFVAATFIEKMAKQDAISKTIVANSYKNAKVFTATVSKLMEKSPSGSHWFNE